MTYALIAVFYASLLGMAAMVLLKRREVRTGRPSLVSRLGAGSDHFFQEAHASFRKGISYVNRRTFAALAHLAAFHVLLRVRKVYVGLKHSFISTPHGKKLIDAVRGRGEVRDHGASFYLRHIAADEKSR
ncbi:MAG: hypothetical protein KGI69_01580 [Patescibacteria group bacterium]|nr:hypothetical protein [Patescibacteria group bacterium]